MAKKYMNKNILILLFPLIICGCNSTSTTTTPSTSLYLGEYGDIMNDFLPNEGEVKLLFKHSEEEQTTLPIFKQHIKISCVNNIICQRLIIFPQKQHVNNFAN